MATGASALGLDQAFLLVKSHRAKRALTEPRHVAGGEQVAASGLLDYWCL